MIYISIILFIIATYCLLILPTQWLKTEKINHSIGINKKILQISDLHMERLRIKPSQIEKVINKEKPDYIFLTGDFLDTEMALKKLKNYLLVIQKSNIPAYAVLGNHDYRLNEKNLNILIDLLKQHNIQLLMNENILFKDFNLVGIDDYCTGHHNIEKSFKDVDKNKKTIVMTHDPNIVLTLKEKYDYLIAGHLHGMQINIPILFGLTKMGKLVEKGVYKGLHSSEYGTYYISKGIGQSGINIRLFVRSEVTIHYL